MLTATSISTVRDVKPDSLVTVVQTNFLPTPPADQEAVVFTINDLLLERVTNIPEEPLVGYPATTHGGDDYVYYTATDLSRFADGAAASLVAQGLPVCVSEHHIFPITTFAKAPIYEN
jgi:hypothetical protein